MLGYCPNCKNAIQLNSELRCATHPRAKPKRMRMVVPSEATAAREEILSGKRRRSPGSRRQRVYRLGLAICSIGMILYTISIFRNDLRTPAKQIPEPGPLSSITARVLGNSINVRSGPGTTYDVIGRQSSNSEILVEGRNEAGDWLKLVDPPGWVSAELVEMPIPIDSLPVISAEP